MSLGGAAGGADAPPPVPITDGSSLADAQRYLDDLERHMGWRDVDLVTTCFLLGEEVGELFKAVRRFEQLGVEVGTADAPRETLRAELADEVADVLNFVFAVANRAEIDVAAAFRDKNVRNLKRRWTS
jgi:NTP pyrophosphatase (non-canonical NTP hydrolase)